MGAAPNKVFDRKWNEILAAATVIRKSNLFDDPKLELFFSFIVHVYRLLIELLMIVRGWQLSV